MKAKGYKNSQIAGHMGISQRTVKRLLAVNPDMMCTDGTPTRKTHKILDPYKKPIKELIKMGFQTSQILERLKEMYPDIQIKRTTLSDYCVKLRQEIYDYTQVQADVSSLYLPQSSILSPYSGTLCAMLAKNKLITDIFDAIKADGFTGSYSLLQQACQKIKPKAYRTMKGMLKIKRRDLTSLVWSGKSKLPLQDIEHIKSNYPILCEIERIISEFRKAFSDKDTAAICQWCDTYSQCRFPAIRTFIDGIAFDREAFYNSMKYEYSNGLLEGKVNMLKAVKRSMFGRASYNLLRAKILLLNTS